MAPRSWDKLEPEHKMLAADEQSSKEGRDMWLENPA